MVDEERSEDLEGVLAATVGEESESGEPRPKEVREESSQIELSQNEAPRPEMFCGEEVPPSAESEEGDPTVNAPVVNVPVVSVTKVDQQGLSKTGRYLVGVAIVAWLGLFLGGIVVDTRPFRKTISEAGLVAAMGPEDAAKVAAYDGPMPLAFAVALFFYTPTNLAILTLFAGLLGTLGRKASLYADPRRKKEADRINPKLSAFLRSYLVYLFFLSGVLVFADEPFSSPTPSSYLRLAGLMSLLSFAVNYTPSLFARVLESAHGYLDSNGKGAGV